MLINESSSKGSVIGKGWLVPVPQPGYITKSVPSAHSCTCENSSVGRGGCIGNVAVRPNRLKITLVGVTVQLPFGDPEPRAGVK